MTKNSKKRKYSFNEGCENQDELVEVINNHIYFYCSVTNKSILSLIKHIRELNVSLANESTKYNLTRIKIYLHINSFGGELFASLSAVDTIINSKIPIVSIIEGCAASAATLISIVCHERQILPNASMLIHQLSSGFWGKYLEIKDDFINLTYLEEKTKNIYKKYSNNKLTEKKLKKILKRDIWWDADKCFKLGLVDKIIQQD